MILKDISWMLVVPQPTCMAWNALKIEKAIIVLRNVVCFLPYVPIYQSAIKHK